MTVSISKEQTETVTTLHNPLTLTQNRENKWVSSADYVASLFTKPTAPAAGLLVMWLLCGVNSCRTSTNGQNKTIFHQNWDQFIHEGEMEPTPSLTVHHMSFYVIYTCEQALVTCGVLQGSILGIHLFQLLHTSSVHENSKICYRCFYTVLTPSLFFEPPPCWNVLHKNTHPLSY